MGVRIYVFNSETTREREYADTFSVYKSSILLINAVSRSLEG
jgi:hypothetical protein